MDDNSKCKKSIFCDFELSRDLPDARIEVCAACGKKVIYRKIKGKYDEKKYLRDHIRDTVQPCGKNAKLFYQLYGAEPVERARRWQEKRISKEKQKDTRKELKEKRKFLHRRAIGHSLLRDNWKPPPFVKKMGRQKI